MGGALTRMLGRQAAAGISSTTVRTTTPGTTDGGWQSGGPYTLRQNIAAAGIADVVGNYIRVWVTVPALTMWGVDDMVVSNQGAATFDLSGTPAHITWDGGSAVKNVDNTGSGSSLLVGSDFVSFSGDGLHALVFAALMRVTGMTSNAWLGEQSASNMSQAYKAANDIATLIASGYTNHTPPKDMFTKIDFGV